MSRRERVRKLIDGELDATQKAKLLAEAERDGELARLLASEQALQQRASTLREVEAASPPPDLAERAVQHAVRERRRARQAPRRWIEALVRPRVFRIRLVPANIAPAVAAAIVGVVVLTQSGSPQSPSEHRATEAAGADERHDTRDEPQAEREEVPESVPVRFVLPAREADRVTVAGDFNDWSPKATPLDDGDGDGVFARTLWLQPGRYSYMFVIDGQRWVTDPYATNYRNDGFGNRNAVLRLD